MEDLNALAGENSNKCSQYSTDEETCLKAYMTRQDGTGDYSPCEYSLIDDKTGESRYRPEEDYDTRCHSSQVRLEWQRAS